MTIEQQAVDAIYALEPVKAEPKLGQLPGQRTMNHHKNECSSKCPGRRACALNPAVRHTLHLCTDPTCLCHQRVRYQATRTLVLT